MTYGNSYLTFFKESTVSRLCAPVIRGDIPRGPVVQLANEDAERLIMGLRPQNVQVRIELTVQVQCFSLFLFLSTFTALKYSVKEMLLQKLYL